MGGTRSHGWPPTNVRRDLVPPTVLHAHIVQLLVRFTVQPDDGQYTRPKHVAVYPMYHVQLLVKFTVQPDDDQYTGPKHVVVYPMYYSG